MIADSTNNKMAKFDTLKNYHLRVIALEVKMGDFRKKSISFKKFFYALFDVKMFLGPYNSILGSFYSLVMIYLLDLYSKI